MEYNNKRERFREAYKSGITSPNDLCRYLVLSKKVVLEWIDIDFMKPKLKKRIEQKRKFKVEQKAKMKAEKERIKIEAMQKLKTEKERLELEFECKYRSVQKRIQLEVEYKVKTIGKRKTGYTHARLIPQKERFIKLYQSRNYTIVQLVEMLGVSRGTLIKWRRQYFPEGSQWKYLQFVKFYTEGYPLETIQYFLHCTRTCVLRYLKRYQHEREKVAQNT